VALCFARSSVCVVALAEGSGAAGRNSALRGESGGQCGVTNGRACSY
jgi:hypothetical protein